MFAPSFLQKHLVLVFDPFVSQCLLVLPFILFLVNSAVKMVEFVIQHGKPLISVLCCVRRLQLQACMRLCALARLRLFQTSWRSLGRGRSSQSSCMVR